MRYLKIILVLTILMALLYLFSFISQLFFHDLYQYVDNTYLEMDSFNKFRYFISVGVELVLFGSLLSVIIGLFKVTKNGYFNISSSKFITGGGILFMIAGLIDVVYCLSSTIVNNNLEKWLQRIFTDGLLIILGLVCLIVSDVIKTGSLLKTENDLTI